MRTRKRVLASLFAASLLLPVPTSALLSHVTAAQVKARQTIPLSRRELNRHQRAEQRQLNLYFRRLSALLRAHQLVERRLLRASPFTVPAPAAPIPTPFPF
ncbi:MAG TPA: hypothetical protein VF590_16305 [Isosphaeraceae bacterium]